MSFLNVLLFVCGIYLIVNTVKMKQTGEIQKGLISNKVNLERAKDIPGYISYMYVRGLIFGGVICVFSAIMMLADFGFITLNTIVSIFLQVGYFAAIIYYAIISVKAQNKFLFRR